MEESELRDLETLFAQVEDTRVERIELHRLRDIIFLRLWVSGGRGMGRNRANLGKRKRLGSRTCSASPMGSLHNTFGRVFAHVDPKQFEASIVRVSCKDQHNGARGGRHRWQDAAPLARFGSRQESAATGRVPGRWKIAWCWPNSRAAREIERDHSDSGAITAVSTGRLYCHH